MPEKSGKLKILKLIKYCYSEIKIYVVINTNT